MNGIGLSSELLERLAGSLLHFLWQGALLALIGVIVLRLMAPRSAESRYAAAVVTMALMLLTPVFTFLFYAETGSATLGAVQLLRASVAGMAQSGAGAGALRLSVWIVFVWSLGVGFCSTRLIAGWVFSRRVIRAAGEAVPPLVIQLMERVRGELQERRAIRLLAGKDVASPVVFGWIRPVVLLPVSAVTGLSEDQLLAVLAHEVAHIRRHDFLVNSLQRAVECVLFYHPAVWWISGRIRVERERCCDDLAVRVCGDRLAYAKALVALENARGSEPALAIPAAGRGVADRVRRLLGVQSPTRDWQSAAIALLFVAMLLVAGAWQPVLAGQAVGRAENPGQAGPDISAQPAARLSPAPTVVQAAEPERQQPVDGIARVGQDAGATLSAALAIATAQDVSPKATSANPEPVVISGRVRDSSGAPAAARTWVRARPEVRQARNIDSYIDETDSEGRYQLDVPPGRYTLTIQDFFGVYPGGTIQAPQKVVTVVAGQRIADVDLEFTFVPSGPGVNPQELRGQVVIDDGGSLPVGTLGRFQVILFS
ncbi:MAG TPA: M56 family metallopeptidase, partial [Terriglobia bacterium]|nr:M56 family metallopeptidase [Terriglobia bacterium]